MTATQSPESDGLTADVHQGSEFVVIGDPTVIQVQDFSSLLTQDVLLDLGEVDVSWFTCNAHSIQSSPAFSDDEMAPNVEEGCSKMEHECLQTPPNAGIDTFLKTPNFYGISPFAYVVGRGSNLRHSTPDNLTLSLGATMGGHELSWSSSMATPVLSRSVNNFTKDNSHADDSHSRINKPAISKKLFNSHLPPATMNPDNSDNEKQSDSVIATHLGAGGSSGEYCSRLESTPLQLTSPFDDSSLTTHDMKTKNTNKMPIRSPLLRHTSLLTKPEACSHSAHDQDKLLMASIAFSEAEIENPGAIAPVSCCNSEDTPKLPKQRCRSHAKNVILDLCADTSDCDKEIDISPIIPTEYCPIVSREESICILPSSLKEHNLIHQDNLRAETIASISTVSHAVISSGCNLEDDLRILDDSCPPQKKILKSPSAMIPHEPLDNNMNSLDIINRCAKAQCINSERSTSLDNGFHLTAGHEEFKEKDNPKLNAEQCTSIDDLQKEYVQLENMMVPEPVFAEDADSHITPPTSLKEFLSSDIILPLGPCAVKVDNTSAEILDLKSVNENKEFEQVDDSKMINSKPPWDMKKAIGEPSSSQQVRCINLDEDYQQNESNGQTPNICVKIPKIAISSCKSTLVESVKSNVFSEPTKQNTTICSLKNNVIPQTPCDTCATNLISEALDDQDDDIFLNICSYDYRTKLRSVKTDSLGLQVAESVSKLLEHQMASNKSTQPGQNFAHLPLANGEAQSRMKYKGFALASGKSVTIPEAAWEKARNIFKEDDLSMLSYVEEDLELDKGETTSPIQHSVPLERSAGLIETSANLEGQMQESCSSGRWDAATAKPELILEVDVKKAQITYQENDVPLLISSEHQSVLCKPQEKISDDCKTELNMKSNFKKPNNLDRSSMIISRLASTKVFNDNESLMIGSKLNVFDKFAFNGFSTANGKHVAVSETALKKAKNMFKDENLSQSCTLELNEADNFMEEKQSAPDGFKSCVSQDHEDSAFVKISPQLACKGFSSASGKPVFISKAALDKGKSIFLDDVISQLGNFDKEERTEMSHCVLGDFPSQLSNLDKCVPPNSNNSENNALLTGFPKLITVKESNFSICQGFSTASGKAVLLSKAALEKAQSIFKEDGLTQLGTVEHDKLLTSSIEERKGCEKLVQECESTVEVLHSEKHCSPSANAADQADFTKQASKNAPYDTNAQVPIAASTAMRIAPAFFPAFSLASGKQVHISNTSLETAKCMFAEESLLMEQTVTNRGNYLTRFKSVEKDTNPNNSMEDALFTTEEYDDKSKVTDNATTNFHGFLTASGKEAPVSADALQQARASLTGDACRITSSQECNSSQQFAAVPEPNVASGDFRIESVFKLTYAKDVHSVPCKNASVSDLCKKRPFATADDCEQNICKKLKQSVAPKSGAGSIRCGFSTASGETVTVSKKSLQVARNMFDANEKSGSGLQVVPRSPHRDAEDGSLPCPTDDLNVLSEHEIEDENVLAEKSYNVRLLPVVLSVGIVDESQSDRLFAVQNEELSTEILESTDALLADEMTFTPCKGEKRSSSWLSPIQGRPKKLFSGDDAYHSCDVSLKTSVPETYSNAADDSSIVNVTKCYWRSMPVKLVPLEIQQMRMLAVEEQLMNIAKRKHVKVSAVPGVLWQKKLLKESKASLRSIVNGKRPRRMYPNEAIMHEVKLSTLKIQSFNAGDYQFLWEEHYDDSYMDCAGITLGSGSRLIFNEENMAGKNEFYRAFLDTPGVDCKLIDENWVFNQYRWIVWKLAAMEISFPMIFGGRLLTPNEVMLRLHYRYNCEIDFSQRSALKKIMERDDTPAKTLVLCVVGIQEQLQNYNDSTLVDASTANDVCAAKCIEVTDGWYSIKAVIDDPLMRLVQSGKICIGQKLIVHGAELIGPTEACTPLEAPLNLALKISANSCRRAKWDAKLGYFKCPKPFPLPLMSFFPDGGLIGCIQIVVARIYPIQYFEKRYDGTSAVYNDRTNNKAALQFENRKSILMEKIFLDVQSKFNLEETKGDQASRRSFGKTNNLRNEIKGLVNGDEIYLALENSADPNLNEHCLSSTQRNALMKYKETLLENRRTKFEAEIQKAMNDESEKCSVSRNVIPFLKLRAVGTLPNDLRKCTGCLITLWRPAPDVYSVLQEGKAICAYYLLAESRSFSSIRQQELHLKSTKMTKFEEKYESDDILLRTFTPRKLTSLDSIGISGFSSQFNEIDIIGLIAHIGYQEQSKFDFVYLTDTNLNIAVIKFWCGLKAFGLDNYLKPGAFVLASNIQWRGKIVSSDWNYLYSTEFSTFSQRPKDEGYNSTFNLFQSSFENAASFAEKAKEKIIRMTKEHINASTPKQLYFGQPSSTSTPLAHCSEGNGRLDTPPTSVELVQHRFRQLSKYGTPPPLPNLIVNNCPSLKSRYQTPAFVPNSKQVEPHHKRLHAVKNADSF